MAGVSLLVAVSVWHADGPTALDGHLRILQPWGQRTLPSGVGSLGWAIAGWVVDLGSAPAFLVGSALTLGVAAAWKDARGVLYCALAQPAVLGLVEFVGKEVVHRTRYGSLSYPSMHAAAVAALATTALVLLRRHGAHRTTLVKSAGGLAVVVGAVSLAILYRDFHEPTDVVGGVATGASVALLVAAVVFNPRWNGHAKAWRRHPSLG